MTHPKNKALMRMNDGYGIIIWSEIFRANENSVKPVVVFVSIT